MKKEDVCIEMNNLACSSSKKSVGYLVQFFILLFLLFLIIVILILVVFEGAAKRSSISNKVPSYDEPSPHSSFYGISKYECVGKCFCGINTSERRRSTYTLSRGVKYVVSAVTTLLAINLAEGHFEEECESHYSEEECPRESISSEVEKCVLSETTLSKESGKERSHSEESQNRRFSVKPIGIVRTPYKEIESRGILIPEDASPDGIIEIFEEYIDGIKDVEGFSHIYIIFRCDRSVGESVVVKCTECHENKDHTAGVFATRSPNRPNLMGMTIVKVEKVIGNLIYVHGVDMFDGTPVIDIKPYFLDDEPSDDDDVRTMDYENWKF